MTNNNQIYEYIKHWEHKLLGFHNHLKNIDFVDYKDWITNWLLKNSDPSKLTKNINSFSYIQYAHLHFIRMNKKDLLVHSNISYLDNMAEVEDDALAYQDNGANLEVELAKIKLKRFLTDDEYKLISEIMGTNESVYRIIKRYNISSTKYLKFMERVKKILIINKPQNQDYENI